jgi:ABC-2 type transport system ATP-binding protein
VTVFVTTHNLAEAEKVCNLVGVVRQGVLLAVGTPAELRARGGTIRAEVTGRGFADGLLASLRARPEVSAAIAENGRLSIDLRGDVSIAPLVRLLVEGGAEIEEVRKGHGTLEEAFLSLVEAEA